MNEILYRLERQLGLQYPDILLTLNPPASIEQIELFEATVKQKLPLDVKTAYLWHNGCRCLPGETSDLFQNKPYFLIGKGRWLSLDEMLAQWHIQLELYYGEDYFFTEEDDQESWGKSAYRPWCVPPAAWLAISRQYHMSHVYIDLLPGPKGKSGQLVNAPNDGGQWSFVANSFKNYITNFTEALERQELVYDRHHQQWLGLDKALQNFQTN